MVHIETNHIFSNEYLHISELITNIMEDIAYHVDDICRFCLSNKSKESFKIFFAIEESTKNKFEDITQTQVNF